MSLARPMPSLIVSAAGRNSMWLGLSGRLHFILTVRVRQKFVSLPMTKCLSSGSGRMVCLVLPHRSPLSPVPRSLYILGGLTWMVSVPAAILPPSVGISLCTLRNDVNSHVKQSVRKPDVLGSKAELLSLHLGGANRQRLQGAEPPHTGHV